MRCVRRAELRRGCGESSLSVISSDRFWEGPLGPALTAAPSRALLRRPLAFSGTGDEVTVSVDDVIPSAAASTYDLHNRTAHSSPGGPQSLPPALEMFP
ncbi:unnamed protein product [Coccothraustes coccothraustes]